MVTNGITYGVTSIQSESVSYTRNGETKSVKQALDELINTSLTEIDNLKEHARVYKYTKLYDVVKVGDYVAYDVGTWQDAKEMPTSPEKFGGYSKGQSKNDSISRCYNTTTYLKGWRVLKKDNTTKTVTLVHAGQPECYYYQYADITTSKDNLNNQVKQNYLNKTYATEAHAMTYQEAFDITRDINSTVDNLRKTSSQYILATEYNNSALWGVGENGNLYQYYGNYSHPYGYRPVVVLKSGMLTTGQEPDKVGNEKAWTLVLPN